MGKCIRIVIRLPGMLAQNGSDVETNNASEITSPQGPFTRRLLMRKIDCGQELERRDSRSSLRADHLYAKSHISRILAGQRCQNTR